MTRNRLMMLNDRLDELDTELAAIRRGDEPQTTRTPEGEIDHEEWLLDERIALKEERQTIRGVMTPEGVANYDR